MFPKVRFEVSAGLYIDFLNYMLEKQWHIFNIVSTRFGFRAVCYAEDYKTIAEASRRYQCKVRIIEKTGIYFTLRKIKKRKGLLVGAALFLILSFAFSYLIWDIKINTEDVVMKNEVVKRLYNCDIKPGSFYTEDKLLQAEENIIRSIDGISYLSLNFYKGLLVCETAPRSYKANYISDRTQQNIYSKMSGIITDIRVYTGYSQVELGQSVSQGDLLVSDSTTDIFGNTYYSDTRAYIEALCNKTYSVFIPFEKTEQLLTGQMDKDILLEFLDTEISIKTADLSQWQASTEKSKIQFFSLFGFHLPMTVKTIYHYQLADMKIETDTLTARAIARLQLQNMIDNDILLKNETDRSYDYIISEEGLQLNCIVTGNYQIS